MRYLKWLLLLSVVVVPYIYLYLAGNWLKFSGNPWSLIGFGWLAEAAALAFLTRDRWTAKELALDSLIVKLVHIPACVLWFVVGIVMVLFLGVLVALVVDTMAVLLSGLGGLAAVLKCPKEDVLDGRRTNLHGIMQFVFCADVLSTVLVYRNARENKEDQQ